MDFILVGNTIQFVSIITIQDRVEHLHDSLPAVPYLMISESLYDVPVSEISRFAATNRLAYTLMSAKDHDTASTHFEDPITTA